jgi:site-specific recombinase XerD
MDSRPTVVRSIGAVASCVAITSAISRSGARCLLESGHDIRTVQELLGHSDVRATTIYTHVLKSWRRRDQSLRPPGALRRQQSRMTSRMGPSPVD